MDILALVNRAAQFYDQATDLYKQIKPSIDNLTGDRPDGLEEAKTRLEKSMERANNAHAALDHAIKNRLNG